MNDDIRDVIIVGSGPAGYTAAIYTARAGMRSLVLEGSVSSGGSLMKTTEVENYPGFPEGVMGPVLMSDMRAQAEKFGAELITEDAVNLELTGEVKQVTDAEGNVYRARAVILAMGTNYRHLELPEEQQFSGHGVSWCATCDGFFFRNKEIAVVGGGDSAVEAATFLTRFATKVTLIHRRDQLRASNIMVKRAQADPKIEFAWNSRVVGMRGDSTLQSVIVRDTTTNEDREMPIQGLFEAIGVEPRSELVQGQVELKEGGYVQVQGDSTLTNLPGVFACGDLTDAVYQQAISAAGTGCRAALDAGRYLAELDD